MTDQSICQNPDLFSARLFALMQHIHPGVATLELYEFRYCLNTVKPADGWASVVVEPFESLAAKLDDPAFYQSIQIRPKVDGKLALDGQITSLTQMLLVGLACGAYTTAQVRQRLYFDLRGFFFLARTTYFTDTVLAHFDGKPYRQFSALQKTFETHQAVGYPEFKAANAEVDASFFDAVQALTRLKGTPVVLGIAGPTAAGKTEIVARLNDAFHQAGRKTTSMEMDHFLTDRDDREARGVDSLGPQAIHVGLFQRCLEDLITGKPVDTPRYDFITGSSSHDIRGHLKPGGRPVHIEPADVIFIEGNFPFMVPQTNHLVGIKAVYLTDDPVRLQRKWKRDMDYRKKYELNYFRNRYFKDQYLMAQACFISQLGTCDLCVDTTAARLWASTETASLLDREEK
jgi:uridine kinase